MVFRYMKNSRFPVYVYILGLVLIPLLISCSQYPPHTPRVHGTLPREVYVWQRSWDPGPGSVQESLSMAPFIPGRVVVLGAEISFDSDPPDTAYIDVDYDFLQRSGIPVGIALRIGPYSGPFNTDDETATLIANLADILVTQAASTGVDITELQIDFDCAESKLGGYITWLRAIRNRIDPVPVTITVLPSWMNSQAFGRVIEASDGFVLQLHSLERPGGVDDDFTLCDTSRARFWIEWASRKAGDLKFRVALPTYGYTVMFNAAGEFIGLSAEGPRMEIVPDTQYREVGSDADELADLVGELYADHPENLEGIIWFRMPVAGDTLNWPWETLTAVSEARHPESELRLSTEKQELGLYDIYLVNDGEIDESTDVNVAINWTGSVIIAYDTFRGFSVNITDTTEIHITTPPVSGLSEPRPRLIRPGEKWLIAWLRFDGETGIETSMVTNMD